MLRAPFGVDRQVCNAWALVLCASECLGLQGLSEGSLLSSIVLNCPAAENLENVELSVAAGFRPNTGSKYFLNM